MPLLSFLKKRIREKDYPELQKRLRKIRVTRPIHDYVAQTILYSIVVALVVTPAFYFVFSFFLNLPILYSIGLSIGGGFGAGFAMYQIFLFYPKMKATNREKEIEDMLPHATAYMLALSKGGFEPIEIFDSLSNQVEYGEIAKEAGAVARNSEILGYSPIEAIEDVARTTPSKRFSDFLTSFSSIIETGSSIPNFLHRRSERYYEEMEEQQEEDLEFLGLLSEVYVTSLGLGPIFGIIILILFGIMGQFMTSLLYLIVYLLIPMGTGLFILILDMQSRTQFGKRKTKKDKSEQVKNSFFSSLNRKVNNSKGHLKSIEGLVAAPLNFLLISLPAGILVSAISLFWIGLGIESAVTFFALVSMTPLAVLFEIKRRREKQMINIAPDFLTSLSDSLSSGLPPSRAIFSLDPGRYGALRSEIERIRKDIEWGNSVSEAFQKAADRIESGIISRIMSLIKRSSEVASDISGILDILGEDVKVERTLQQERNRVTTTYVIIVFLSFGIFLLTAYSLSSSFIPLISRMSEAQTGAGGQTPVTQIGGVEPSTIKRVFFHASLLQGFFSGLLAGMMKTGKLSAGLKFSMIMLGAAWGFFTFLGI